MQRISAKRTMNGTFGEAWLGGEQLYEISAFQAKISFSKEKLSMAGRMMTDTKIVGCDGTGSLTIKKVFSRTAGHGKSVMNGIDERLTVIGKLADPDACGAERVALYGGSLDEETLMDFSLGKTTEQTISFTFTDYEWLEEVHPA